MAAEDKSSRPGRIYTTIGYPATARVGGNPGGRNAMQPTTFFSRWFSAWGRRLWTRTHGELPLCLAGEDGSSFRYKFGPNIRTSNHVSIRDMPEAIWWREERFQRRFRQLAAGGWSFRTAAVIALFDHLLEPDPL
jgi:hypothetical protein